MITNSGPAPVADTVTTATPDGQSPQPAQQPPTTDSSASMDADAALSGASDADIDAVLEALSVTGPEETTEQPEPAVETPQAPQAASQDTDDDGEDKPLPKNFRLHTEDPTMARFLQILKREPGVHPSEAWKRAGGTPSEQPAPQTETQVQQQPETSETDSLKQQLEKLKADRKAKRAEYDYEAADDLSDEIAKVEVQIATSEMQRASRSQQEAIYNDQHSKAKAAALKAFPSLADPKSPLSAELVREKAFIAQTEPEFFDNPTFPLELLKRVKERRPELFVAQKAPQQSVQAMTRPNGSSVVTGNAGSVQPLTKQTAIEQIGNLSDDDLDAILTSTSKFGTARR